MHRKTEGQGRTGMTVHTKSNRGLTYSRGFSGGTIGKDPTSQCKRHKRRGFGPWVRKIPWRRAWEPTLVFLPEESHGQRILVGYSPKGHKKSDRTEAT